MADSTTPILGKHKADDVEDPGAGPSAVPSASPATTKKLKRSDEESTHDTEAAKDYSETLSGAKPPNHPEDDSSESDDESCDTVADDYDENSYDEDEEDYDEDGDEEECEEEYEDEREPEHEVEEHEFVVKGDEERVVKLKLHTSKEEEFENWLEDIHVRCTCNGTRIGSAFGRIILRERIRAHFWRDMEEPSQDMSDIAFDVFDRYGYVKRDFKNHCIRRGTGVWGPELDHGSLLLIERIEINDRDWRRKGLGRAMVNSLIEKVQKKEEARNKMSPEQARMMEVFHRKQDLENWQRLHILVLPGFLASDVEPECKETSENEKREINERAIESAIAFFRSLGFRRIGASYCFGYSSDPDHKSHELARIHDYDPPKELLDLPKACLGQTDDDKDIFFWHEDPEHTEMESLKQKLPLHHATVTLQDSECVDFFKKFTTNDGTEWKEVDRFQNTLLHVAACQLKLQSVKWLMKNYNAEQCLSLARNLNGHTPFECLQDRLEIARTERKFRMMKIDISDQFRGFAPEAVSCLSELLRNSNTEVHSSIKALCLTYGCTCGECLEGFMSPRMKLALLFQAEIMHDMLLDMEIDDGSTWCDWHEDITKYVAPDIQRNFHTNKSLRRGFSNLFDHVATCLRSNKVPRTSNVLQAYRNSSEWPPVTRNYLERGGQIVPVLRTLFDHAMDQDDRVGDGEFERAMEKEVAKLKECRNDHEFEFVALACGLPQIDRGDLVEIE